MLKHSSSQSDWQPQIDSVQADQRAAYDHMREHCPVAHSEFFQWSVFRHQDVKDILLDHQRFSNNVSRHVSVPNGMDLPEHTAYRALIEPYFSAEQVARFKPKCQEIADTLANQFSQDSPLDLMAQFAEPFAAQVQCSFMGWSESLAPQLTRWAKRNNLAVLAEDRQALTRLAQEFEVLIAEQLELRRNNPEIKDFTADLLHEKINGQALTDQEIASILRNWTVGEVGTIAASIGIIAHFLASYPSVQQQLRAKPELLWQANDEILRLHNPLVDNRRRTTCPVELSGKKIAAEERITINWIAANRDPEVFENADQFILDRDQSQNLLYGAGLHVCPGEGLAKMELVVVIRSLLQYSQKLTLAAGQSAQLAKYPMSGYAALPINLSAHSLQG